MIPFEFIVEGPPISAQTKNRKNLQRWKNKVRDAAIVYWPTGDAASKEQLVIRITYYFDTASPDVDNIVKPIQDALIGLVYEDDNQITDSISRKRDINGAYKIRGVSKVIAEGFCTGNDFLHIKVYEASGFEEVD
ncbi:RusA family crossover junction endodeoxyribonuclease [Desulfosporosinus sp. SB140]|uniref:RusA family crossover junction endodeoxyribonuclease n=1 Tax=Desulfosporosinus paludis TaxID=3115649 RepID=UPI00388DB3C9